MPILGVCLLVPWDRLVSALHSALCYIALMAKIKADAWKCDLCGHVWLVGEMCPKQCAKCRSRIWNCDGSKVVESPAVVVVAPTSKPAARIVTETAYQRPAHAANCRCFQCKPPKD